MMRLDGRRVGKTVMEMEGSDRFKEYLKGQITELGDGLDMGVMNDFRFLACIVIGWRGQSLSWEAWRKSGKYRETKTPFRAR